MKMRVFPRNYYGKRLYYPIDELSKMICKLLKQNSLTEENLKTLKDFGWEIDIA